MSKGREVTRSPEVDPWFPEGAQALRAVPPPWCCPAIVRSGRHGSPAFRPPPPRSVGAPARSSRSSAHCPASLGSLVREGNPSWRATLDPKRSCVVGRLLADRRGWHIYEAAAFVSPEASR